MKLKNVLLTALCLLLAFPLSTCGGPSADTETSLPAPMLTSALVRSSGVLVKWEEVEGARQYRVLRRIGDGSWIRVADTDGLSLTDKAVENGGTYSYTVRCVSRDGGSFMSGYDENGLDVTYHNTPKLVSAKASDSGITVVWEAVEGVPKYRLFRKIDGEDAWEKVIDLTETSYTDTTAQAGTTYRYTVRGLSGGGKSFLTYFSTSGIKAAMK